MEIRKVGVLGCGLMGSGIAQICAQAGYETVVREVSQEFLDKGFGRVRGSLRHIPRMADVTMTVPDFLTPRQVIQVWTASMTTATPLAASFSIRISATCDVSRSCTCGLLAKASTTRASLLIPTTLPSGR